MAVLHSPVYLVPGLGNSGEGHWQSRWEKALGLTRIQQDSWDAPVCSEWSSRINQVLTVSSASLSAVILIGHSLGCPTIAAWARQYRHQIKAALLVAPCDTEADSLPGSTSGFYPMSLQPLPFRSIVVASHNDPYVHLERARYFARCWGSEWVPIGKAGHINTPAGFGDWPYGLQLLEALDKGLPVPATSSGTRHADQQPKQENS